MGGKREPVVPKSRPCGYGRTKLHLLPVCEPHHQNIHNDGWLLSLTPDRTLTIQFPDGSIMTTGPPKRGAA